MITFILSIITQLHAADLPLHDEGSTSQSPSTVAVSQPSTSSADFTDEQSAKECLTDNYGEFTIEQVQYPKNCKKESPLEAAIFKDNEPLQLVRVDTFLKLAKQIRDAQGEASLVSYTGVYFCGIYTQILDMQSILTPITEITEPKVRFDGPILLIRKSVFEQMPQHLTHLYLDRCGLITLPSSIGHLRNLQLLGLAYNRLESLPPEIGSFSQLTNLYLNHNYLKSLPPEFGNLTQLESLYLNNNDLESLPPEFGKLSQLYWLQADNNKITLWPPEMANLTALKFVHVESNNLTTVPDPIKNLPILKGLALDGNPISPKHLAEIRIWLPNCQVRFSGQTYQEFSDNLDETVLTSVFLNWLLSVIKTLSGH